MMVRNMIHLRRKGISSHTAPPMELSLGWVGYHMSRVPLTQSSWDKKKIWRMQFLMSYISCTFIKKSLWTLWASHFSKSLLEKSDIVPLPATDI